MTQANIELLDALKAAGAPEEKARAAAQSVAATGEVATKADLARLESRMLARMASLESRMVAYLVPVYALLAYLAIRLA